MALKKKVNNTVNLTVEQLKTDIRGIDVKINILQREKEVKQRQLVELEIKPFKIGGYALVEIPCGKTKKEQKCLLECENGILYARPVKADGELSGRHFSLISILKPYSELLKEVK